MDFRVCLGSVLVACGSNAPVASTSPVAPTASEVPGVRTRAVAVSGVVVADGRPIDNALVMSQWSCGTNGCSAARGSVTDAAGRYTIDGLPEGQPVWVTAEKDGFVQQCIATVNPARDKGGPPEVCPHGSWSLP
jgi:Carboxypeptidase regulatory-like domain